MSHIIYCYFKNSIFMLPYLNMYRYYLFMNIVCTNGLTNVRTYADTRYNYEETYGEYSYTYDEFAHALSSKKKNTMSENLPKTNSTCHLVYEN